MLIGTPIRLWLSLFIMGLFSLPTGACASQGELNAKIFNNIQLTESFRAWNEKSFGGAAKKCRISVIRSPSPTGEIVLLRWSDDKTDFTTEVYQLDKTDPTATVWRQKNDTQITLVDQQDGSFLILQLIPGKNGGQRQERFILPEKP